MAGYETIPELEHLYLEDSWVLGVFESDVSLSFDLDAVLTERHPQWHPPKAGEQDWGNIDRFVVEDDVYELQGGWGHVRVVSDPPQVSDRAA